MKDKNELNKARVILALIEAVVLALLVSNVYFTDECHVASLGLISIAVVLSAIVMLCRWPLREGFNSTANATDAIVSLAFFAVSVYSLTNVI